MKKVIAILLILSIIICGGILSYNHVQDLIAESYNSGYDAGYSDGDTEGYARGKDSGYSSGYSAGKNSGYVSGFIDGRLDSQPSSSSSSPSYSTRSYSSDSPSYSSSSYYIGNVKTGVFHYSTCSYLPQPENSVAIYSRASAIAQGYRPCGHCNP